MEVKILIDGKEYTIEEAKELKLKLDEILKQETLPWYPPINVPWQQPVGPYYEHPYIITTSPNSDETMWMDMTYGNQN